MVKTQEKMPFTIEQVLDTLGIDWMKDSRGRHSFNIQCPCCDQKPREKHLNISLSKQVWRCPKCDACGNAVHLASYLQTGRWNLSKTEYSEKIIELSHAINGEIKIQKPKATAKTKEQPDVKEEKILPDEELDKAFSALIKLPEFKLSDQHKQNLLDRGLSEEAIVKNGYCTFPDTNTAFKLVKKEEMNEFRQKYRSVRMSIPALAHADDAKLALGANIASKLKQQLDLNLLGVPGFFSLEKEKSRGIYCFTYPSSGIGIPTRNLKGQIVGMQIRTDKGKTRYLTLSSKDLPRGVATDISRCHAPLANVDLLHADKAKLPEVILTEGPLKADVALHLLNARGCDSVAFLAIPGVSTTSSFFKYCENLKQYGYSQIELALDMDKVTNVNVMKGSKHLSEELTKIGFSVKPLLWDEDYASDLLEEIKSYYAAHKIVVPQLPNNVCASVAILVKRLGEFGLDSPFEWRKETKGIDDFLKNTAQ